MTINIHTPVHNFTSVVTDDCGHLFDEDANVPWTAFSTTFFQMLMGMGYSFGGLSAEEMTQVVDGAVQRSNK